MIIFLSHILDIYNNYYDILFDELMMIYVDKLWLVSIATGKKFEDEIDITL